MSSLRESKKSEEFRKKYIKFVKRNRPFFEKLAKKHRTSKSFDRKKNLEKFLKENRKFFVELSRRLR